MYNPQVQIDISLENPNNSHFTEYVNERLNQNNLNSDQVVDILNEYIEERWGDLEAILTQDEQFDIHTAYTAVAEHIRDNFPQEYDQQFIDTLTSDGWTGFNGEYAWMCIWQLKLVSICRNTPPTASPTFFFGYMRFT